MAFFKEIEGEAAILVSGGVYVQVPLYMRGGYLFAKSGGGFVRLMSDGSTSKSKTRLDYMSWTGDLRRDSIGRLCTSDVAGSRSLEESSVVQLLGAPETA